jgi:hypothetical protein
MNIIRKISWVTASAILIVAGTLPTVAQSAEF